MNAQNLPPTPPRPYRRGDVPPREAIHLTNVVFTPADPLPNGPGLCGTVAFTVNHLFDIVEVRVVRRTCRDFTIEFSPGGGVCTRGAAVHIARRGGSGARVFPARAVALIRLQDMLEDILRKDLRAHDACFGPWLL